MKKKITDKIILKVGASLLSFGILLGSFIGAFPVQVSAADLVHDHTLGEVNSDAVDLTGGSTFDPYVTPKNVEGKILMGTDALRDPVAKTYTQNGVSGTYYDPQTYIYFGSSYSAAEKREVPILLRVLDAEKDNAGNSGAMFVMTEQAIHSKTIFSQYRKYDDEIWYGMFDTENVYNLSVPYSTIERLSEDDYLGSYKAYYSNLAQELDYIRPVTVIDRLAPLDGVYGYGSGQSLAWELDTRTAESAVYAQDNDEIAYIDGARFFLLSAEEMSKYVSTVPFAPGMATTLFGTDTNVTYWLRTGLDYHGEAENGNFVGAVDETGNVIPFDTGESAYIRYGFNIETGDIQFMYEIAPKVYRLTFIDPTYKAAIENADPENGIDDRFTARVVDVKNGLVTLEVGNAIRHKSHTSYGNLDESIGISVMIKDKDGNVTHYAKIEETIYGNDSSTDPSAISKDLSQLSFRLPEDYDRNNDEVYVFWEMTQDDEGGATFISNMVKLDCLHPNATEADCIHPASCPDCGEFGGVDKTNHVNVDETVYYVNKADDIHWNVCDDCKAEVNVQNCVFGDSCRDECICGNSDYPADMHSFNEDGICEINPEHFEAPTVEYSSNLIHATVRINNEGQFIAFAKMFNSGEIDTSYDFSIFIENDLDFRGIDGFEPIGTEEQPFNGYLSGKHHTVSNVKYSTDGKYAGLFGYAEDISIRYLTVTRSEFSAAEYASALVGRIVTDGSKQIAFEGIEITDSTVNATRDDGVEGILIGTACNNVSVYNVYALDVMNGSGEHVRFFSDPELCENISVNRSACLYETRGEYGEFDADAYASGEVAHLMGKGQKIGTDLYPSTDNPSIDNETRVFKVSDCAGNVLRYTNEYLSVHHLRDYTEHRITKFYEFVWHEYLPSAQARVYCDACKQDIFIEASISMTEVYAPVRCDYIASVTVNGENYSSEPKRFIGTKIQDMIGMTNKVVEFDGGYVYTDFVLDNYKLIDNPPGMAEFEAYFLDPKTGERITETQYDYYGKPQEIPSGVYLPGSYDLLVVGKRAYAGQEYVYEDALTITPITVNVTVADVYKYYDGSTSFEPVYSTGDNDYSFILEITVSDAPSSDVGIHDLKVGVEFWDESFAEGIEIVFSRDTVKGYIFPRLQPDVENKNYPTEFTYGDDIPDPSAKHFTTSEECELAFDWFKVEYDQFGDPETKTLLDSKPVNAGDYLLRVTASGENCVTTVYELPIEIKVKELTLKFEGMETVEDEYGNTVYVIDMYQTPEITVEGFVNGDTAESVGAFITYYQESYYGLPEINDRYVFPYQPCEGDYSVRVTGDLENYLLGGCNYERAYSVITVRVNPPQYPTPIFGDDNLEDGEKQEIGVVYSWTHPTSFRDDKRVILYGTVTKDGEFFTSFELYDEEYLSSTVSQVLSLTDAGEYSVNIKAKYEYEDEYISDYDVNVSFTVGITNQDSEMLDSIIDVGDYTVAVTSSDGTVRQTVVTVCREIYMEIKPFDYEISEGYPEYDNKNFIMQAGKVVLLGHEITDVIYELYPLSGYITVSGIKVVDREGRDVSHLYSLAYNTTDIHIFDSPCDSACNVHGCDHIRAAKHSGGAATCNTLAICELCGDEYGDLQAHRHTSENTVYSPNPDDKMTHNQLYTCCGAVKSTVGHTPEVVATCTSLAICAECGWAYGDFDPDNHSSDEITYAPSTSDPSLHVGTHACCKATFTEEHKGGRASCSAQAICDNCKTGYGETDPNHHVNVTYTRIDSEYHGAKCNDCSVEWQEKHTGGTATCTDLAKCDGCASEYGEYDSNNHTSDETKYVIREENRSMHDHVHSCCNKLISKAYHSGGEANCASAAICDYCKEQYGDKDPDNHASTEVIYKQDPSDPTSHIKQHACCEIEIATELHGGAGTATCEHGDICDVCGIEYTEKTGHVYNDEKDTQCNVCGKKINSTVVTPTKTGGCRSSIGCSAAIVIVAIAACIPLFRKKED